MNFLKIKSLRNLFFVSSTMLCAMFIINVFLTVPSYKKFLIEISNEGLVKESYLPDLKDSGSKEAVDESYRIGNSIKMLDRFLFRNIVLYFSITGILFIILVGIMIKAGHAIVRQKIIEAELYSAREIAERASRHKGEFLANMSHEIRTPLSGAIGMIDLALDSGPSSDQRDYLEMAHGAANSLLYLLNDIFDFSKIQSGRMVLENIEFNIRKVLLKTTDILSKSAGQKGLTLACANSDNLPEMVAGDPKRLHQVLYNLVKNAIKFTEYGEITIYCERLQDGHIAGYKTDKNLNMSSVFARLKKKRGVPLHFTVKDTGVGIDKEIFDAILDPFTKADSSKTRKHDGTGLGLSICKELVAMMGGHIWVDSKPGKGSTFHFVIEFDRCEVAQKLTPPVVAQSGNELPPLRILLAEDNPVIRIACKETLQKKKHIVSVAQNGIEVMTALESQKFDLILMDISMPEMDGIQATKCIREKEMEIFREESGKNGFTPSGNNPIPIIALTGHDQEGDSEGFIASGMDEYVLKPIKPDDLMNVIARVLSRIHEKNGHTGNHIKNPVSKVFDMSVALENNNGSMESFQKASRKFFETSQLRLERLKNTCKEKDNGLSENEAHQLKKEALKAGARRVANAAFRIELDIRKGDLTEITSIIDRIEKEIKIYKSEVPGIDESIQV